MRRASWRMPSISLVALPCLLFTGHSYSAFGYSLFLVPAFWVFDHPHTIYFASLVISALLMSTLYLGLYYVLTSILGSPSRYSTLAAIFTCLYPPILLRANFAWADAAYLPGFVFLVALFGILLRQKSVRTAILFGLLLGFMYTIHPRSLPLIPIAALYLVILGLYPQFAMAGGERRTDCDRCDLHRHTSCDKPSENG